MRITETPVIIGNLRSAIAGVERAQERIGRGKGGRELALARTKVQEAMMWTEHACAVTLPSSSSESEE